ncbi:hypothetical protein PCC7418_1880 [Halothece sp. PCC 7418]|uniref:acyltransferase family protein n=1 Tax=Halothece sp. (strain PCC 7418) TaxID=65093 RepID=UPI0002A07415|nr:acyltransferase [Halothece sp. PCC 7418]AFZ44048.1 hypothetical protein PCC7418_1880 [Halothece sp. PCC 7418]
MKINKRHPSPRWTGIDLFRGFAIFGVIILHADEGIPTHSSSWAKILEFSGFAVPFFLATSFYLAFQKIYQTGREFQIKPRLIRLLLPYLVWTGIYVSYKALKYLLQNESDNLNQLFHDPIALIFFGGAAFQLYFLPLLLSGTLLIKPISGLTTQQTRISDLIALCLLSLVGYQIILTSGNYFDNASGLAFQSLFNIPFLGELEDHQFLRILLVEIAFMIRCLPYLFIAALITHPKINLSFQNQTILYLMTTLALFLMINLFGGQLLPISLYELSRGYTALLLALALSHYLPQHPMIKNLSVCSFGIYLIHLLFVDSFQIIENRLDAEAIFRMSTPNLLMFAILVLAISWVATDFLMKKKFLARLMFGI